MIRLWNSLKAQWGETNTGPPKTEGFELATFGISGIEDSEMRICRHELSLDDSACENGSGLAQLAQDINGDPLSSGGYFSLSGGFLVLTQKIESLEMWGGPRNGSNFYRCTILFENIHVKRPKKSKNSFLKKMA